MKHSVIVFDIDGTLCYHSEGYHEMHARKHFECVHLIDPVTNFIYIFKPYLLYIIDYLISRGARIAFYSAGDEERNEWLVRELMTLHFGPGEFERLRNIGHFMIRSKQHIVINATGEYDIYRKDLRWIIQSDEGIQDVILIDDTPTVVLRNQSEFVSFELFDSHCEYDHLLEPNCKLFYKNGMYYLLGILKTWFENEWAELTLRSFKGSILFQSSYISSVNATRAIASDMIKLGLDEVRKTFPEAILYGASTEEATRIIPEISEYFHSPEELLQLQENLLLHCTRAIEECTIQVLLMELKEQRLQSQTRQNKNN